MNNTEIAKRIRKILYNSELVWDDSGHLDHATNFCRMKSNLIELLLDILNAPKI